MFRPNRYEDAREEAGAIKNWKEEAWQSICGGESASNGQSR
jgi:hypothetical protein